VVSFLGVKAAVGFEPTNNGFAIRPLGPLGYAAEKRRTYLRTRTVAPGRHGSGTRFLPEPQSRVKTRWGNRHQHKNPPAAGRIVILAMHGSGGPQSPVSRSREGRHRHVVVGAAA
jgi:hypothetical protein